VGAGAGGSYAVARPTSNHPLPAFPVAASPSTTHQPSTPQPPRPQPPTSQESPSPASTESLLPSPPAVPSPIEQAVDAALAPLLPTAGVIETNPARFGFVGLPTWLWIDPEVWHPVSVDVAGIPVSATATPEYVRWDMGDGHQLVCGPGTPYQLARPADAQQTDCSYDFASSSAGQSSDDGDSNDSAYQVRATIWWSVSWTSPLGLGSGVLSSTSTRALRVEQVESIGVAATSGGGGP
jgi:hypothetical protein